MFTRQNNSLFFIILFIWHVSSINGKCEGQTIDYPKLEYNINNFCFKDIDQNLIIEANNVAVVHPPRFYETRPEIVSPFFSLNNQDIRNVIKFGNGKDYKKREPNLMKQIVIAYAGGFAGLVGGGFLGYFVSMCTGCSKKYRGYGKLYYHMIYIATGAGIGLTVMTPYTLYLETNKEVSYWYLLGGTVFSTLIAGAEPRLILLVPMGTVLTYRFVLKQNKMKKRKVHVELLGPEIRFQTVVAYNRFLPSTVYSINMVKLRF